jgi:hypothetical protein
MAKTRKVGKRRNLVKKHKSRRKAKGKAYEEAVSALLSKKLNDVRLATYGQEFVDPGDPPLVSQIVSQLDDTSDTICEICLKSMIINSNSVVTLGCTHKFHAKCLKNQIESGDTACFICRTPMTDKEIESILAKRRIRTEKQAKRREEIEEYEQFRHPERPPLAQTASLASFVIDEIVSGTAPYGTPKHLLINIVYYLREIELLEDELRQYTLQIQKEPLPPQIPNISLKQALADEERMDNIVRRMRKFRVEAHFYYNFINTNASANDYIAEFKNVAHKYLSRIKEKIIRMKDKTDELLPLALDNKRAAEQIVRRLRVSRQSRDITRNIM